MISIRTEFLPHRGSMVLLAAVARYDNTEIVAVSHPLNAGNPLARNGQISCLNIIEYAAQTAAVHLSLLGGPLATPITAGVLATIRNVELMGDVLPLNLPLEISASCRAQSPQGCSYSFVATSADAEMGHGDLVIAFRSLGSSQKQGNV